MKERKPAAFMSYVRADDKNGHVTQFRERLSDEVRVQTGEEFPIFQDKKDILWGQNWKERIEESLDQVTFLIPIITPSFFKSQPCRDEFQRFLEREEALQRRDLILPVYYVDTPVLNSEEKRLMDPLAQVIGYRQYIDWRELRFELYTSPQVSKMLERLARHITDALERVQETTSRSDDRGTQAIKQQPGAGQSFASVTIDGSATTAKAIQVSPKTEPPTRIVDPLHRGNHTTITEAIAAANPGDRILVRPGLYQEGIVMSKPLEIVGDGEPGEVVVQANGADALLFETTMGRVVNLTLRQIGDGNWYGVDIAQGRLELEECDVSSQSSACVAIHHGADPRIRRNRIHDGRQSGVYVYENGLGTLEDNEIFGNGITGVAVSEGGDPTLRRNRINNNSYEAVWIYSGGAGTFEDNDLRDNARGAWDISSDSEPNLKRSGNLE